MKAISIRTFRRRFRIETSSAAVHAALSFLHADPEMEREADAEIMLPVRSEGAFHSLGGPADQPIAGTGHHLAIETHRQIQSLMASEAGGATVLRAASAIIGGARTLILGGEGFARSRLLIHLMESGAVVEGGGAVLLDGGRTTAWPQRLPIRSRDLGFLDSGTRARIASHVMLDWNGAAVHAVVPALDRPWRIGTGAPAAIVLADANPGGRSVMGRAEPRLVFEALLGAARLPAGGRATRIAELARLAASVRAHRLWVGDSARAASLLTRGIPGGYGRPTLGDSEEGIR